jgi:acetyl-CoA acetyltransferase
MRDVAVIGAGLCKFGFHPERGILEMGEEAVWNALQDAGMKPEDIQIAYCGTVGVDISIGPMLAGHQILQTVGITGIPIARVENMCSSSSVAFRESWFAIQSGLYDIALAFGAEKLTSALTKNAWRWRDLLREADEYEGSRGLFPTIVFSLMLSEHMAKYGTTREQAAMVAVKNRFHASMSPYACFQKPITIDDVFNSRPIARNLNLLDCCPSCDGCSAVILASGEVAKRYTTKPVYVAASAQVSGTYKSDWPPFLSDVSRRSVKIAYEMAGIGPEDLDVAEIHDAFDINEIVDYEDLGFCGEGEGGPLVQSGATKLGGRLPVNTGGGLMSRGHPFGATGCAQIAEITWQLKGQAGARQVQGAKVGLTHTLGGAHQGDMGNCYIHIFKR